MLVGDRGHRGLSRLFRQRLGLDARPLCRADGLGRPAKEAGVRVSGELIARERQVFAVRFDRFEVVLCARGDLDRIGRAVRLRIIFRACDEIDGLVNAESVLLVLDLEQQRGDLLVGPV